jgi:predicted glutamine amidotransferase
VRSGERPAKKGDDPQRMERYALIASEPLEVTDAWKPVTAGELVLVDEKRRIKTEPISLRGARRRVA